MKGNNRYLYFLTPITTCWVSLTLQLPSSAVFNSSNVFPGKPKSRALHPCGHNANYYFIQTTLPYLCHSANQKSNIFFLVHPWPRPLQENSPQLWMLAQNDKLTLNIFLLFAGLDEWDTGLRPRNVPSGPDSLRVRYPGGILSPTGLPTHQHRPQGHVRRKSPRCLFCQVTLLSARKEQSKMRVRPE